MIQSRTNAPRIAIGGVYLDQVATRVEQGRSNNLSVMTLPAERHSFVVEEGGGAVVVTSPALTMMQLCFDGVVSAESSKPVTVRIEGHLEGTFFVEWLRRVEGFDFGEPVHLRLRRHVPTRGDGRSDPGGS